MMRMLREKAGKSYADGNKTFDVVPGDVTAEEVFSGASVRRIGLRRRGAGGGKASGGAQGSAFSKESAPLLEHCWSTHTNSFSLVSVDVHSLMASVLLLLPMDASASSTVRMASLDQWQLGMSLQLPCLLMCSCNVLRAKAEHNLAFSHTNC